MNPDHNEPERDDIEALLRQTGTRVDPPADVANEIRRAVHAEWQAVTAARKSSRRIGFGIAASIAAAMLAVVWASRSIFVPVPVSVGFIERLEGTLAIEPAEGPAQAQLGQTVSVGETLVTNASARVALRVSGEISVRLDHNTAVAVLAPDRLELRAGTLYVDAGMPGGTGSPLDIMTTAGRVHHLGTQYQVRSNAASVIIGVREGRVELAHEHGQETANGGEQLTASPQGKFTRATLSPDDPGWAWTMQIAPPFEIENQSLAAFLQWAARETGRTLVYASPSVETSVAGVRLRGSIANLTPDAALTAVLATTQFERTSSEQQFIRIDARGSGD